MQALGGSEARHRGRRGRPEAHGFVDDGVEVRDRAAGGEVGGAVVGGVEGGLQFALGGRVRAEVVGQGREGGEGGVAVVWGRMSLVPVEMQWGGEVVGWMIVRTFLPR